MFSVDYMLGEFPNADPNIEPKPLVIFGAGASYDLVHPDNDPDGEFKDSQTRPPLANNIFDSNHFFQGVLRAFPRISGLIGMVKTRLGGKKSLEEILDDIQNDPKDDKDFEEEHPHLINYIVRLFYHISNKNRGIPVNNYDTFFRAMRRVCKNYYVVNFNYDLLAQWSIEKLLHINFNNIESYIRHEIKLIQIHGSVSWKHDRKIGWIVDGALKLGAEIVLPTASGKTFACPKDHTNALTKYLVNEVNVIIIIGWKGVEAHFKDLLDKMERPPLRIIIVGGEKKEDDKDDLFSRKKKKATSILKNCGLARFPVRGSQIIFVEGFSNFIKKYHDFSEGIDDDDGFW